MHRGMWGEERGGGVDVNGLEHGMSRPELATVAYSLVQQARDETRQRLLTGLLPAEDEAPKTYADGFWFTFAWRLRRRHRDAMNLYAKLLGLIGGDEEILRFLLSAIECGSLEEAKQKIRLAREMEQVKDEEAAYRVCMEAIRKYRSAKGLPMLVEPEAVSEAQVLTDG